MEKYLIFLEKKLTNSERPKRSCPKRKNETNQSNTLRTKRWTILSGPKKAVNNTVVNRVGNAEVQRSTGFDFFLSFFYKKRFMTLYIFVVFLFDSKKKLSTRAAQSAGGAVSTKTSQRRRHEKKKRKNVSRSVFVSGLFVCLFVSVGVSFLFLRRRPKAKTEEDKGRTQCCLVFFIIFFCVCVVFFAAGSPNCH